MLHPKTIQPYQVSGVPLFNYQSPLLKQHGESGPAGSHSKAALHHSALTAGYRTLCGVQADPWLGTSVTHSNARTHRKPTGSVVPTHAQPLQGKEPVNAHCFALPPCDSASASASASAPSLGVRGDGAAPSPPHSAPHMLTTRPLASQAMKGRAWQSAPSTHADWRGSPSCHADRRSDGKETEESE